MTDTVEIAWAGYRDSLEPLFHGSAKGLPLIADATPPTEPDEETLKAALEQSGLVHSALEEQIASEDPGARELAALKLQAAAAVDFDNANRLAAQVVSDADLAPEEEWLRAPVGVGGFLSRADLAQIDQIMSTPVAQASSLFLGAPEGLLDFNLFGADKAPTTPDALKQVVENAIDEIVSDSSALASKTLKGLIKVPRDELLGAVSRPVAELFDAIDAKLGHILRHAAKFVWRGIEKLLAIFGTNADALRKKVGDWVTALDADKIAALLKRLFSTDTLKKTLDEEIDAKGGDAGSNLDAAATSVAQLAGRLKTQMNILGKVVWVLGKTQGWLVKVAPPYGVIGVAVAYVVGTGYAVDAAQDYLDWGEARLLDLVDGVKHDVESNLA